MRRLVHTVESAGYLGLIVTVDAPIMGNRETGKKTRWDLKLLLLAIIHTPDYNSAWFPGFEHFFMVLV